jgi:hypothetical protein
MRSLVHHSSFPHLQFGVLMILLNVPIEATSPFLKPVCFAVAWLFMFLLGRSLWLALRDAVNHAGTMHKIPCAKCQFFTGNYQLKCTVHPSIALSEAAIDCPDYRPASESYPSIANDSVNEKEPIHANTL